MPITSPRKVKWEHLQSAYVTRSPSSCNLTSVHMQGRCTCHAYVFVLFEFDMKQTRYCMTKEHDRHAQDILEVEARAKL